jgi:hypothetical protein
MDKTHKSIQSIIFKIYIMDQQADLFLQINV